MNVAAYLRVSSKRHQADRWSLPAQREAIARHCAQQGWGEPRWYVEAHTAKDDDPDARPVFRQLLADAAGGRFAALLVVDVDRFARSVVAGLEAAARFERAGVRVVSLNDGDIDTADPDGEFSFTLKLMLARRENRVRGRKSKAGLDAARAAGRWVTKPPFGARIDDGRLALDPATAPLLARILREAATETDSAIAARLTDEGIVPPGPRKGASRWGEPSAFWWPETVRKIVHRGAWLAALPPPWPDLWRAAARRPRPVVTRPGHTVRMLSGLAVCPCGGRLGYGGRVAAKHLICRNPARGGNGYHCGIPRRPARYYEALVAAAILALPDPAEERAIVTSADPAAWADLAEDRRRLDVRYKARLLGDAQLAAELAALEAREAALPRGGTALVRLRAEVAPVLRRFHTLDPADQNALCRALLDVVACAGDVAEIRWGAEARALFGLP